MRVPIRPASLLLSRHPARPVTDRRSQSDLLLGQSMNMSAFRTTRAVIATLAMLSLASPSLAQQQAAPASQQGPVSSQPPVVPAQAAPAPAQPAAAQSAAAPTGSDASATPADAGRSLKSTSVALRELSPWSLIRGKLRRALATIGDARSLAEAQFALGAKRSVLSALLSAAMREARLSAGISSDSGIKERAASSFAEIVRAEARRVRLGMGLLATIGATSPFVGLFGTVWGIMNSFIGISKSQTTNLAVVAPGIAEALLATALGLVAAIPAVIIYNHFARVTKGYLELVGRASGAAGRLLSRDLDRTHGATHSRAAE